MRRLLMPALLVALVATAPVEARPARAPATRKAATAKSTSAANPVVQATSVAATVAPAVTAPPTATVQPSLEGRQAPWLAGLDLESEPISLARVLTRKGTRGAVVLFWNSWSRPCRDQLEQLRDGRERLKAAGIEVLLITQGEEPEAVSAQLEALSMKGLYTALLDRTGSLAEAVGQRGGEMRVPLLVLVARRHQEVRRVLTTAQPHLVDTALAALSDELDLGASR